MAPSICFTWSQMFRRCKSLASSLSQLGVSYVDVFGVAVSFCNQMSGHAPSWEVILSNFFIKMVIVLAAFTCNTEFNLSRHAVSTLHPPILPDVEPTLIPFQILLLCRYLYLFSRCLCLFCRYLFQGFRSYSSNIKTFFPKASC